MIQNANIRMASLCLVILLLYQLGSAEIRLPRLISSGMVLQRQSDVKIWGWADAHEPITLHFLGKSHQTVADDNGEWSIILPQMEAGGPFAMEIIAENRIVLDNILVGEVWVCSGQSNMDLNMGRVATLYGKEIENSTNSAIRRFFVSTRYDFNAPQKDFRSGSWDSVSPESILRFTAVGYFFAKALYEHLQIPIGLIHASVGGSPAEAWLSEDALKAFPHHLASAIQCHDSLYVYEIMAQDQARNREWHLRAKKNDLGSLGATRWTDPAFDVSAWPIMQLPGLWKDQGLGDVNGVVWFRKEIDVPTTMIGVPATLLLGRIVDADSVYVNGTLVGTTSYQYPPRRYTVPVNVLKPGNNVIIVRVMNYIGAGGFIPDKPYELTAGDQTIDLRGPWCCQLGAMMEPLQPQTFIQWKPMGLFNGMIAPLLDFAIKGIIWYQGEANISNPLEYRSLFPALIADWRENWRQGDFPFLYVQLANYGVPAPQPTESAWAELREAQLKTLSVPQTGMAVAIDIGEWNDIHPLNKKDVGERLALAARKIAYDEQLVHSGPIYKSKRIKNNKIIITFTHTGSGLIARGGELKGFAIAGADKKFVWAQAEIDGNRVAVWNDNIPEPFAVRYAWADNPQDANLVNREGLSASPFRTDE